MSVCTLCGAVGHTTAIHSTDGGRVTAAVAHLCRVCLRDFSERMARKSLGEPPFSSISTGQSFPRGVALLPSECEQCGRAGPTCTIRLCAESAPDLEFMRRVCAECLADFVAATQPHIPDSVRALVSALCTDGVWRRLGIES